jgi:hypothetical protein
MSPPPRQVMAAEARRIIELHDEWDRPHAFEILHWDGARVRCSTHMMILADVPARYYPRLMMEAVRKWHDEHPDYPPYAYLVQIEAFGVADPRADAGEEERRVFEEARRDRTFHEHPDRHETVNAWCADIHGRLWAAMRVRGSDEIHESYYAPGRAPGGGLIRGVLACAAYTGAAAYGLQPSGQAWN